MKLKLILMAFMISLSALSFATNEVEVTISADEIVMTEASYDVVAIDSTAVSNIDIKDVKRPVMVKSVAGASGGCSDPNGSDWIEKRWVNGQAQFIMHTTRPTRLASFTEEVEYNISAATANAICYGWNNG